MRTAIIMVLRIHTWARLPRNYTGYRQEIWHYSQSLERAMRHAIELAWDVEICENNKFFGFTLNGEKGKPTNSDLLR